MTGKLLSTEEIECPRSSVLVSSNFDMLPDEKIVEVMNKLDRRQLLKVREVCNLFKILIDTHCLILPEKDEEIVQIINSTVGKIPDQLKIPHWQKQQGEEKALLIAKRLTFLARKYYGSHHKYYTPDERRNSMNNLDRYRMLIYVSYKLGNDEAFQQIERSFNLIKDELKEFHIHLPSCSPQVPNLKPKIYAFLWELLARINPYERSSLALAYRGDNEKNRVLEDHGRSQYWASYRLEYDFPSDLFQNN